MFLENTGYYPDMRPRARLAHRFGFHPMRSKTVSAVLRKATARGMVEPGGIEPPTSSMPLNSNVLSDHINVYLYQ
jgi:hypothetical protein